MSFHRKALGAAAAFTLLCSLDARADWTQSLAPLVVQPSPANSQVQAQNPPSFI